MSEQTPTSIVTLARAGLLLFIAIGTWRILQPFLPAIVFAAAIVISTWPGFRWLERHIPYPSLASLAACFSVGLLIVVPSMILAVSIGDAADWLLKLVDSWRNAGPVRLPDWMVGVPLIGAYIDELVRDVTTGGQRFGQILSALAEPARDLALAGGRTLGSGLGQALLMALLLFFFYRDGSRLASRMTTAAQRLAGQRALGLLQIAQATITGVMLSVIGAGLAQATVAVIGFAIVGAPNPFLLGALTFILSLIPIGPPLVWGAVALSLMRQGEHGRAVLMVLYGFFVISSVDNLVKPMLISRSSRLPFALTLLGVLGGVVAFGVVGVFVGPTLLALALKIVEADESSPAPSARDGM